MAAPPTISVCVPYGGSRPALLGQAVASAQGAALPGTEVLIVADGPQATAEADGLALSGARVVGAGERRGLVATWNRCLTESSGDLVHLLHDDDAVRPGFYTAVAGLFERFPGRALYATGFAYFETEPDTREPPAEEPPADLSDMAAAEFLLRQRRHVCGSVVLARTAVAGALFDAAFPFCPDEEAYLRWAAGAGLAYDARPLYLERMHPAQERYRTWRRPEFVGMYVGARVGGAANFGPAATAEAERLTAANVTRIALRLAAEGEPHEGAERLAELRAAMPAVEAESGYRRARRLCETPVGRVTIRVGGSALLAAFRLRQSLRRRRS